MTFHKGIAMDKDLTVEYFCMFCGRKISAKLLRKGTYLWTCKNNCGAICEFVMLADLDTKLGQFLIHYGKISIFSANEYVMFAGGQPVQDHNRLLTIRK
jgi:hypothetical protein